VGGLTTRVAVAAESAVERAGIVALLSGSPSLVVVHASEHVRNVDAIAAAHDVDVVVLVARTAGEVPLTLDLAPDLHARSVALVVLLDGAGDDWIRSALAGGVHAVLPRDVTGEELYAAVRAAAARLVTLTRDQYAAIGGPPRHRSLSADVGEPLTRREQEVLEMLADGLANKEIAAKLRISSHTVKTHVQSVFAKLGADSRAEAVAVGVRRGLILL
jgi:DNA-binding NarL/FixJ family response regulator